MLTVTEEAPTAPLTPPVPLPDVGLQFAESPTGTPYPKLDTLYPGHDGPTVDDGMVLPWLSKRAPIRFTLSVQTSLDTDGDGKPDRLTLRVVQPAEVAEGLKTPVIVRPTPYLNGPDHDDYRDFETKIRAPFLGEEQYLRMGFTVVYTDSLGTNTSEGCPSIMDGVEREANASVVRWLANDPSAKGFDGKGVAISAAGWSTGHVAMEGVSYGGTMPSMAAATGVTGLEAIVPVDGISSAYDYFDRYNGVSWKGAPVDVPSWQGGDAYRDELFVVKLDGYASDNTPKARRALCASQLARLSAGVDNVTFAYNAFWKERNTLALAGNFRAATLIAHGQADNNVKTKNGVQLYDALYRLKKPVQFWFHSRDHDDPAWQKEWQKQILLWYTRYLFGVNNGVEKQPTYVRETPNGDRVPGVDPQPKAHDESGTLAGHCHTTVHDHSMRDCIPMGELMVKEQAWPATRPITYVVRSDKAHGPAMLTTDAAEGSEATPISFDAAQRSDRITTRPFANATRFAGTIRLMVPVKYALKATNIKAYLFVDDQRVTLGFANPHFHDDASYEKPEAIALGTEYRVPLEMMPRDFTVPPGSTISIRFEGYDDTQKPVGRILSIDLAHTTLEMPLVPSARVESATQLD